MNCYKKIFTFYITVSWLFNTLHVLHSKFTSPNLHVRIITLLRVCVRSRKSYKNLEQKMVRRKQAEASEEEGRKVRNRTRSQLRTSILDPKHFTRSGMDSMAPLCPIPSLSPARHPVPLFPKTRLRGWVGGWGLQDRRCCQRVRTSQGYKTVACRNLPPHSNPII